MQKRLYVFFNFFAFNLLFFALYLNFFHKDAEVTLPTLPQATTIEVKAIPAATPAAKEQAPKEKTNKATSAVGTQGQALKLSLN